MQTCFLVAGTYMNMPSIPPFMELMHFSKLDSNLIVS